MKLVRLEVTNVGPFSPGAVLTFEPDTTVITGRNDSGKSAVLRLVELVCAKNQQEAAAETDINTSYLNKFREKWATDDNIYCKAVFLITEKDNNQATYTVHLAPERWPRSGMNHPDRNGLEASRAAAYLPSVLRFGQRGEEGIRQQLNLAELNPTEKRFVAAAFGADFTWEALKAIRDDNLFSDAIDKAQEALNTKIAQSFPSTNSFRIRIGYANDKRNLLLLSLTDALGHRTPLGKRGTGVQKMLDFVGRLAAEGLGTKPVIILIDEPETSLHADSQHTMRRVLEEISQQHHVQVIYATHSPCMVNCMRPKTVRLMKRRRESDGTSYSVMDTEPFAANFASVRSSLGISPADSLLYAPLVVVVEGKTETLCLPYILDQLHKAKVDGYAEVPLYLSQCAFLTADGTGNFPRLCALARSHGCKVLGFCDGDTEKRWRQQLEAQSEKVELSTLPQKTEFENLVPLERYVEAIREHFGLGSDRVSVPLWQEWEKTQKFPAEKMFSKRIARWCDLALGQDFEDKDAIMWRAAQRCDATQFKSEALHDLMAKMGKALAKPTGTSSGGE